MAEKTILVYADWNPLISPAFIGVLNAEILKGKEVFSFEYDSDWLKENHLSFFDPALQLFRGR